LKRDKPLRRQIFVLTPDEKKAVCCVIGALLLGLATMQYRAAHPRPPVPAAGHDSIVAPATPTPKTRKSRSPKQQSLNANPGGKADDRE